MNRLLLSVICSLVIACQCNIAQADSLPNIVLIISDDQAWTDYSFMGHPTIETPHIDALAKQSVVFRRGYVPTALCRPSLMTIITGLYAHQHGVTGNDPSPKYARPGSVRSRQHKAQLISFVDDVPTLPRLLAAKGYVCHQSGKWWEGNFARGGFTHGMTRGFPQPGGRHGDDGLTIGRKGLKPVTEFIDQSLADKKPFFVWYAPFMPHTPHNPPKRLLEKYAGKVSSKSVSRYYAMCEWFDQTCGQLIQHLEKAGARDNTLIVYVCDNGWIQDPQKNGYAPRSKQTAYEGGVRTPIMLSWPSKFRPADRPELCSSIDLAPTILAAVQIKETSEMSGLNWLEILESGRKVERDSIYGESYAHDIADLKNPEASLLYRWCIQGRWKLILTYDGEVNRHRATHPRTERRPQLFDLSTDPSEIANVAQDHPATVAALADKIKSWYPLSERNVIDKWPD